MTIINTNVKEKCVKKHLPHGLLIEDAREISALKTSKYEDDEASAE